MVGLRVPTQALELIGLIKNDFTSCSYQSRKGTTLYLEEDCDATTFCRGSSNASSAASHTSLDSTPTNGTGLFVAIARNQVLSNGKSTSMSYGAATTRRLMEIARRNEVRREAELPPLSVAKELRHMKQQETEAAFNSFAEPRRAAVLEEILKRCREEIGNPNWKPNWMTGMAIANQVRKILREQLRNDARGNL